MVVTLESREDFSLLVIDDNRPILETMPEIFEGMPLKVLTCADARSGMELVRHHRPQLVLLDFNLPRMNGMQILHEILRIDPRVQVILMSGESEPSAAIEAIQQGAADFLTKPVSVAKLRARVGRAMEEAQRNHNTSKLDEELLSSFRFEGLVGRSPQMLDLFNTVVRIAPYYRSALVSGPSGSGKELIARALHHLSPVRNAQFLVCNCAGIPETLAESELFGYKKNAFTGADQDKKGIFEEANGGTVFLDEIGEMPIGIQGKLLRVLQTREVQRVGSPTPQKLDIRVIAASNRDLRSQMNEGLFREDLFYRLSAVHLQLPSLAQRKEDLPLLQRHFVEKYAKEYKKNLSGISRRAQNLLAHYHWPGNVRQLENLIARAAMVTEGPVLDLHDFPTGLQNEEIPAGWSLKSVQQQHVLHVLKLVEGNKARAAEILGISRTTLYSILSEAEQDTERTC